MTNAQNFLRSLVQVASEILDEVYIAASGTLAEVDAALAGFAGIEDEPDFPIDDDNVIFTPDAEPYIDNDDTPEKLALLIEAADRRFGPEGHQWRSAQNLSIQAVVDGINDNFDNLINERDGWTFEHLYGDVGWGREFDNDEPPF